MCDLQVASFLPSNPALNFSPFLIITWFTLGAKLQAHCNKADDVNASVSSIENHVWGAREAVEEKWPNMPFHELLKTFFQLRFMHRADKQCLSHIMFLL